MKKIIDLLKRKDSIDEYRIIEVKTTSTELFFVKDELQMNRGKDVTDIDVTVYKNFEENGKKYKGSSNTKISPTMTLEEMEEQFDMAALAASFVKNEHYNLEVPSTETAPEIVSKFSEGEVIDNIVELVKDLYEEDNQFDSFINSSEFFINKKEIRLLNSNGIDVKYTQFTGEIELITEANGGKESIELYDVLYFSDYIKGQIKEAILEALEFASLRSKAIPMPNVKNVPVILNGIAAKGLFDFYKFNVSSESKYNKLHDNNVGDNLQGLTEGDRVTISLKPVLENSSTSSYYDMFGTFLKEIMILENGTIKNLVANKRYSDYLGLPCTGNIGNTVVSPGSYSNEELRTGPYLELLRFSDFQLDPMTGDFGGEFRLGIYFDGKTKTPVTQGSIAANIKETQNKMFMSKEVSKDNNYIGPKLIKFESIRIAGN